MPFCSVRAAEDLNFKVRNLDIGEQALLNQPEIELIGTHCADIRTMSICHLDERAPVIIAEIFRFPKPHLTELTIEIEEENVAEVLLKLAELTSTLHKFCIRMDSMVSGGLSELFEANALIDLVQIECVERFTKKAEKATYRILESCKEQLANLEELRIISCYEKSDQDRYFKGSPKKVAQCCVPFRSKKVVIHAFGVDYLK